MEECWKTRQINKHKPYKKRLLDYCLRTVLAWFVIASVSVCFMGVMYDLPLLNTLRFTLLVTAAATAVAGISLYNRYTFWGFLAIAVCAAGAYFLKLIPRWQEFMDGFIPWAEVNMLYIKIEVNPLYTPFAQVLFLALISALIFILLVKLRLPGLVGGAGITAIGIFYYYICVASYENYNTMWALVCLCFFLGAEAFFLAVRYRQREIRSVSALPAVAAALIISLLFAPFFNRLERNTYVQDAIYESINGLSKQTWNNGVFENFSINSTGFASSKEKKLGGTLKMDYTRRFTLENSEPLLLRGATYDRYDGRSWSVDEYRGFILDDRKFDGTDTNSSELYNNIYCLNKEFIADSLREGRVSTYTVSKSVEWTSSVYSNLNMLRVGFVGGGVILSNGDGITYADKIMVLKDRYSVSYISPEYSGENFEKYLSEGAQNSYSEEFARYLDVSGVSKAVKELADFLAAGARSDYSAAQNICSYLAGNYNYSLTPQELKEGDDFVDDFLFNQKEGYCVYFASAMTILARCAGLPARYVEGYRADKVGVNDILSSNAHAWTEVYINNVGWVAFDAVAPADFDYTVNEPGVTNTIEVSPSATLSVVTPSESITGNVTAPPITNETVIPSGTKIITTGPHITSPRPMQNDDAAPFKVSAWLVIGIAAASIIIILLIVLCNAAKRKKDCLIKRLRGDMTVLQAVNIFECICRDAGWLGFRMTPEPIVEERMSALYKFVCGKSNSDIVPQISVFEYAAEAIAAAAYNDVKPDKHGADCIIDVYLVFSHMSEKKKGKVINRLQFLHRGL